MPLARLRITAAMLLILGLLGAPPASTAEAYQESPWLRDDVSAGRLPPVGERLPADPLVVDLKAQGKEIGKPGGTLRMMIGQGSDARSLLPFAYSRLIIYDENYRLTPDILASFDVQEGRIFTFHLREGHRWSDGSPFTTEDFRYYWEDIATNPKLSPDGRRRRSWSTACPRRSRSSTRRRSATPGPCPTRPSCRRWRRPRR
jgi:peptide/nickel transport system substrate-binding protein